MGTPSKYINKEEEILDYNTIQGLPLTEYLRREAMLRNGGNPAVEQVTHSDAFGYIYRYYICSNTAPVIFIAWSSDSIPINTETYIDAESMKCINIYIDKHISDREFRDVCIYNGAQFAKVSVGDIDINRDHDRPWFHMIFNNMHHISCSIDRKILKNDASVQEFYAIKNRIPNTYICIMFTDTQEAYRCALRIVSIFDKEWHNIAFMGGKLLRE